jgi:hypothetical protein
VIRLLTAMALPLLLPLLVIVLDRPVLSDPGSILPRGDSRPDALRWGDRDFTSQEEFARWLRSRGADYATWEERHPGAAPWERETWAARFRDALAAWGVGSVLALLLVAPWGDLVQRARGGVFQPTRPVSIRLVLAATGVGALVPIAFLIVTRT